MSETTYRLVRPQRAPTVVPMLDAAQRQVVEHRGGPLMVLAGPGTGKTTTVVEAIADRVINRGVPIENILVLTFGARAAGELRDRITARLDTTVREPLARTFHSYAFGLLRLAATADLVAPRLLSGTEQDVMLRSLLAGDIEAGATTWPSWLQPALQTHGFASELRDLLLRAAERGSDAPRLAELGHQYDRPQWRAAAHFLQQYLDVTVLERPGAFDAAELIQAAIRTLQDPDTDLLRRERQRRRHIFVDEYQDTDPAQTELLRLIGAGAEEIVVVGDPDQSIYAFRGADPDAMRNAADIVLGDQLSAFQNRTGQLFDPVNPDLLVYPGEPGAPASVALITSRRSGGALLAATRRIAANLPGPVAHRGLVPGSDTPPGTVIVSLARSEAEEAATIATRLRRSHLDDGVAWSQMAIIVRSTAKSLAVLRRAMITAGVPVAVSGQDVPLAEQSAVSQLLTALRCIVRPDSVTDEVAEALLLGAIGEADALYLRRLRRALGQLAIAADQPPSADLIAALLINPIGIDVLPDRLGRPLTRIATVLDRGRRAYADGGAAEDVLWAIWDASGLADTWERRSRDPGPAGAAAGRDLDAVIELFNAAARLADRLPGATADALYDHVAAQQIPGQSNGSGRSPGDAVQILTAHASKGLEWDVVCVANVQEGSWPDLRRRGSLLGSEFLVDVVAQRAQVAELSLAPLLAEERRLFYVATTRARRALFVSAVVGDDEQPSRFLDELVPIQGDRAVSIPTRGLHLSDVVADLRKAVTDPSRTDAVRRNAAQQLARLAAADVPGADPGDWWGLADLSDERGVIDDDEPARVSPSTIDSYLTCAMKTFLERNGGRTDDTAKAALGSSIHEIAELAEATASLAELESMMDERWSQLDFGAIWYGRSQRTRASKMLQRLAEWLAISRDELTLAAAEEKFSVQLDDIVLSGSVDRLELDHLGRGVVIDFKTGASKPKDADIGLHPQLAAYQLAVELGGFAGLPNGPTESGGARLVQLGSTGDIAQGQAPLAQSEDPERIRAQVRGVAALQRGHRFDASINSFCRTCSVRKICPVQVGRQVTQP
jgi:superfamily I DNA/RNA helicase/RecB family exonuclease